jgi:phage FluMu gp28-like protein
MDEGDYFNAVKSECADEESFLQEFCCVPGDDNAAFLSYDLLTSCEYPAALGRAWEYAGAARQMHRAACMWAWTLGARRI